MVGSKDTQLRFVVIVTIGCSLLTAADAIFSRQSTSVSLGLDYHHHGACIGITCKDPFTARSLSTAAAAAASSFSISGGSSSAATSSSSISAVGDEEIDSPEAEDIDTNNSAGEIVDEEDEQVETAEVEESQIESEDQLISSVGSIDETVAETNAEYISTEVDEDNDNTIEKEVIGERKKGKIPTEKQLKRQEMKGKRKKAREERKQMRQMSKKLKVSL